MADGQKLVSQSVLLDFASDIFSAAGVAKPLAREWAQSLVWADLRGVESHGVLRVPQYLDLLGKGYINASPKMVAAKGAGCIVTLDADLAPGSVAMTRAMQEAVEAARRVQIGWCAARRISHAGAMGFIAQQAAESHMAGIVMSASIPLMAYHGSASPAVATNPIAISFPTRSGPPLLLDMSTAAVAYGRILKAISAKERISLGWGIDAKGVSTSDPSEVKALLPVGGAKGSGLSLMIECLASLVPGNPLITRALADARFSERAMMNGVAIAIDISAFGAIDDILEEVERLRDAIHALPRAAGIARLFLPGERGYSVMAERTRDGIPVLPATWQRLCNVAQNLGVEAPKPG